MHALTHVHVVQPVARYGFCAISVNYLCYFYGLFIACIPCKRLIVGPKV
jgi:hypothetical protein